MSPSDADAGQAELFRSYLKGRAAAYTYVFGGGAAFVVGAWQQSPLIMVAGPAAVVLLVVLVAAHTANRRAAERFYAAFATSVGLEYWSQYELLPLTPLLGAGDRRWCEHWMQGMLPGDPSFAGGLGHFVFEDIDRRRGPDGEVRTLVAQKRRFTLCAVELEPSLRFFKGLYVRRRAGLFPEGKDWLNKRMTSELELESTAFCERYELRVADDQDELMARQLLAPSLVNWLAHHPLGPCFEVKAGTLAVYVPRPLEDAGNLTFFLDATRHLAARVLGEVEEALARPAV